MCILSIEIIMEGTPIHKYQNDFSEGQGTYSAWWHLNPMSHLLFEDPRTRQAPAKSQGMMDPWRIKKKMKNRPSSSWKRKLGGYTDSPGHAPRGSCHKKVHTQRCWAPGNLLDDHHIRKSKPKGKHWRFRLLSTTVTRLKNGGEQNPLTAWANKPTSDYGQHAQNMQAV